MRHVYTRPAARFGLTAHAGHLLDLRVKPLATERLTLIESEPDILDDLTIELGAERRGMTWANASSHAGLPLQRATLNYGRQNASN